MTNTIKFTKQLTTQELKTLCDGLEAHAKQTVGKASFEPFGFLVHNESDTLIAGCTGVLMYGYLHIKLLWVDESVRNQGIGKKLLEKAELFAKENNCRYIMLETFNWQAINFYVKHDYVVEHVYEDFEDNIKFYFLRKKI